METINNLKEGFTCRKAEVLDPSCSEHGLSTLFNYMSFMNKQDFIGQSPA